MSDVRARFLNDAVFHHRVEVARKVLQAEDRRPYAEPEVLMIARAFDAYDRAVDRSPDDPLFGDPELHRALLAVAAFPGIQPAREIPDAC